MSTPFRLDGKKALVTGGASGIGEAITRVFASAGAAVTILDIDPARASALASELPGASSAACDVTSEAQVREVFAQLGTLDILVNNAGVGLVGGIEETALEDFQRLMRINVEGVFLVTRAAMPLLVA
jgi:2-keto-3-deoxy-L-fuconate dehydrogenase